MVNYLVGVKFLAKAYSANMVTNYLGTGYLMTLVGGIVADSFLGRFWTIFAAGTIQTMGFVVLMLTAFLPSLNNQYCEDDLKKECRAAHGSSLSTIYVGLYLIAIGTGGIKSCVSAFGADQFDSQDPREEKSLPHYFNVFFDSVELGSLFASTLMIWIQDYKGWKWGYAILAIVMGAALFLLVSARRLFRYRLSRGSPFTPVARVFIAALRNRKLPTPSDQSQLYTGPEEKALQLKVFGEGCDIEGGRSCNWVGAESLESGESAGCGGHENAATAAADSLLVLLLLDLLRAVQHVHGVSSGNNEPATGDAARSLGDGWRSVSDSEHPPHSHLLRQDRHAPHQALHWQRARHLPAEEDRHRGHHPRLRHDGGCSDRDEATARGEGRARRGHSRYPSAHVHVLAGAAVPDHRVRASVHLRGLS